jgi:hypothetical protein
VSLPLWPTRKRKHGSKDLSGAARVFQGPPKFISGGIPGVEAAALDLAVKFAMPYGGFAMEGSMLDHTLALRRYKLWEKPFSSHLDLALANLSIADGMVIFTRGACGPDLLTLIAHARLRRHPCLTIDFEDEDITGASARIWHWLGRHGIDSLFVSGPVDRPELYDAAYGALLGNLWPWLAKTSLH